MRLGPHFFGKEIGQTFEPPGSRCLVLTAGTTTLATITYLESPIEASSYLDFQPRGEGFVVPVDLTEPSTAVWEPWPEERCPPSPVWSSGPSATFGSKPFPPAAGTTVCKLVRFNLTRATLDAYAHDTGQQSVEHLHCTDGQQDPVLYHLAQLVLPYIRRKIALPGLFLEHYLQMLCCHVVSTYGGLPKYREPYQGGLAPWQKRRALEILERNLSGDLRLNRLAAECGISASYFCRCFRVTFGTSLHKYVVNKRIERAQHLLLHSKLSIAEISIESGFSDQAALSRTFAANMGTPPARWRNEYSSPRPLANQLESQTERPVSVGAVVGGHSHSYWRTEGTTGTTFQ